MQAISIGKDRANVNISNVTGNSSICRRRLGRDYKYNVMSSAKRWLIKEKVVSL